jgi:hypothetical protein
MPGGLMSLLAVGAQDAYVSISPEMSYFKQVYRRHTNFSMQAVRNTFSTKPVLSNFKSSFTCKIGRVGDLLQDIYLSFTLPAIYSDDDMRFRWIPNVANYMLNQYTASIDTQLIDQRWGDWLDVWNELSLTADRKTAYNNMTANTPQFTSPMNSKPTVIIQNNKLTYAYYPTAMPLKPSIPAMPMYVPLDFWFCKNPAVALPLVALQYQTININIEFRGIEDLYQIFDVVTGRYYSPSGYRALPTYDGRDVSIAAFTQYGGNGPTAIDLQSYLDCNYIFLDTAERNTVAVTNTDYMIERVYRTNLTGILQNNQQTIDVVLANPIKEMIWTLRRSNAQLYNDWGNYTGCQPENAKFPTLNTAKIMWNGAERFEEKPAIYFNMLQPYEYHTSPPKSGIYTYSYALYPEKIQPSGSFNASMINKIQLYLNTLPTTENVDYELTVYSIYYNIFRVIGGSGAMVFAS